MCYRWYDANQHPGFQNPPPFLTSTWQNYTCCFPIITSTMSNTLQKKKNLWDNFVNFVFKINIEILNNLFSKSFLIRFQTSERLKMISKRYIQCFLDTYPAGGLAPSSTFTSTVFWFVSNSLIILSIWPIIRFTLLVNRLLAFDSSTTSSWPVLESSFISCKSWKKWSQERKTFLWVWILYNSHY